jgi:hypothetical protein
MHGQIIAHMSDKIICIHNKHHSIYEMGMLQHKLKSEFRTHRIGRTQFGECEEGVCLNDGDDGRLTAGRWAAGADELCRGGGLWPSEQTTWMETRFSLYVLRRDNVLVILLSLGDDHLHFAPSHSCRDSSCHDDRGCDLGAPTSQVARWSAARSGQPRHSDQTARR